MSVTSLRDRLGVCSWSLHPKNPSELVDGLARVDLDQVQLALNPLASAPDVWGDAGERLADAGVTIVSGMVGGVGEDYSTIAAIRRTGGVVPDGTWPATLENMKRAAPIAGRLGIRLVTFHAGFIPHDPHHPVYRKMLERLNVVADVFGEFGAHVALETGQERTDELFSMLESLDRPDVGVNFDPANMILYSSGDPTDALRKLLPFVKQIHLKDATAGTDSETWGEEVAVGTGDVDWAAFFRVLHAGDYCGNFIIEREAGARRIADIRGAVSYLCDAASATTATTTTTKKAKTSTHTRVTSTW